MVNDDKFEGEARKQRMDDAQLRISRTRSGARWLDRVDRIGRANSPKFETQTGESSGIKKLQNSEPPDEGERH